MNMRMGTLAGLVVAVALAAGCGSSSAAGTNGGGGGSANTTVQSANSSKLGTSVLVNDKGMTLYTLSAERGGRFICTSSSMIPGGSASCLSLWHPLTVAKGSMPTGAAQLGTDHPAGHRRHPGHLARPPALHVHRRQGAR